MEWQATVEDALQREITAGRLTRPEAAELHRKLDLLAFNMTVAGHTGEVAKTVATSWLFHLRTRKLSTLPQAHKEEQERAARWWSAGETSGLLHDTKGRISFADRSLQTFFCAHYCRSRPFDALLLRLAARDSLREVWQLWAGQDEQLVERLTALLMHARSVRVRYRAVKVLSYLADPRTVGPLIAALYDASAGGVRVKAAQTLAAIGDSRAIEPLLALLQRDNDSVRSEISEALGSFGAPIVPPLLRLLNAPEKGVVRAVVSALGRTGDEQAVGPLIKLLSHRDHVLVGIAAGALGQMGGIAVPSLIQVLKTGDEYMIRCAASALAQSGDPRAAAPLLSSLKKRYYLHLDRQFTRQRIGESLARLRAVEHADLLVKALQDKDAVVRAWAAIALGEMGDRRALEGLLRALKDQQLDVHTRWSVALTLGTLGDQGAVEPLLTLLSDPTLESRLGRHIKSPIIRALGQLGNSRAVESLLRFLHPSKLPAAYRGGQLSAVEALGQLGDSRAIEPLILLLQSEENSLRLAAVRALGKIGDQQALRVLRQMQQTHPTNMYARQQITAAITAISKRLDQSRQNV